MEEEPRLPKDEDISLPSLGDAGLTEELEADVQSPPTSLLRRTFLRGGPFAAFGNPDSLIVPIELKVVRSGLLVELRPHQVAFHHKHASLGRLTFILVEYHPPKTRIDRYAEWLLYGGEQAIELARTGVRLEPLGRWPALRPSWVMLRALLTGRDVPR